MPGATPLYALPYPVASDAVAGLDETFRALVDRLELVLAAANQPPLTPSDFTAAAAAVASLSAAPTLVASPFAAGAGWGVTGTLYQWYRMRALLLTCVNNTGAAIATSAIGMLTGSPTVATVIAGHRPIATEQGAGHNYLGTSRILSTGVVQLLTYTPSVSVAIGASLTTLITYLV